jgi:hypothetical protein
MSNDIKKQIEFLLSIVEIFKTNDKNDLEYLKAELTKLTNK